MLWKDADRLIKHKVCSLSWCIICIACRYCVWLAMSLTWPFLFLRISSIAVSYVLRCTISSLLSFALICLNDIRTRTRFLVRRSYRIPIQIHRLAPTLMFILMHRLNLTLIRIAILVVMRIPGMLLQILILILAHCLRHCSTLQSH